MPQVSRCYNLPVICGVMVSNMEDPALLIQNIIMPLFAILTIMVFLWFYLVHSLYKLLSDNHQALYKEMGEPTLFLNNTPRSGIALMKFIFRKQYKARGDIKLEKLGAVMFALFITYIVLLAFAIVAILAITQNAKP